MLGSLILYLKGMRIMMFQLSGFYCRFYWASEYHTLILYFVLKGPLLLKSPVYL